MGILRDEPKRLPTDYFKYEEEITILLKKLSEEMKVDEGFLLMQVHYDMDKMEDEDGDEDEDKVRSYIDNIIKKGKLGWYHKIYDEYRRMQEEEDEYIMTPPEVEDGVIQCINTKCNSYKVFSRATQTRSADEPTTIIAQCSVCKTKWSENN